ncbi:MAG TPA: response regulator [Bacteroidales bacterium]|nr:response regulator [Bacteroidales bacterium]
MARILIVDDNPDNLQVLGRNLQGENFEIEFAVNGEAAISWLNSRTFDLVLLDINMPGMDGFEVCQWIRSDPRMNRMPVIFLSAFTDRETILKGFELGGQDYITKPFDPRELQARIKTHITLKESIEKLEVEKIRAQAADQLKSAFLATMSHELRTPLNSIIGFTGILMKEKPGPLNDEQKKQMGMVQNSARHLLSLINDVLDVSKIEAGQLMMNLSSFDLPEVIRNVVETNKPMADKKGIPIYLDLNNNIGQIYSDKQRVFQILTNLVNNAVKFTETGSVSIYCNLANDKVRLDIKDTGIGIEKDQLDKLFKPFTQIDTGLQRQYEGTGLGLSICKKLCDLLKGSVEVESVPGKGSVFTVILPLNAR